MKALIFFSILFLGLGVSCRSPLQNASAEGYKLNVTLENAPFDSLYLFDYTNDRNVLIAGKKTGEFTWEILIPDSIVEDSENMLLKVSENDPVTKSSREVRFLKEENGEKTIVANIGVEDRINYIHARYEGKTTFPDENIIDEDFKLILGDDNEDITVRAHEPYFGWFVSLNDANKSYEEYMSSYVDLAKKYPDSRYLISNLSMNLANFKSKKDVEGVYKNFSDKHKNTQWAGRIERFLNNTKFENVSLPTLDRNTNEDIIQDTTKFNLIVFTASWCRPCIEEIPLLKKIYNDLEKDLVLTYISLDKEKDLRAFQKLVMDENIPWRSLLAYQDVEGIMNKYFVSGIPHSVLVSPDKDFEIIDVRDEAQRSKLYLKF